MSQQAPFSKQAPVNKQACAQVWVCFPKTEIKLWRQGACLVKEASLIKGACLIKGPVVWGSGLGGKLRRGLVPLSQNRDQTLTPRCLSSNRGFSSKRSVSRLWSGAGQTLALKFSPLSQKPDALFSLSFPQCSYESLWCVLWGSVVRSCARYARYYW